MTDQFILFYGLEEDLFFACFGAKDQWNCSFEAVSEDCSPSDLDTLLQRPVLRCVVVQEVAQAAALKEYYERGGFIVYFGIYGVFADPVALSKTYGLQWSFSAYTRHTLVLTEKGKQVLGSDMPFNQYSKCNYLKVPSSERLIIPAGYSTLESFMEECCDYDSDEEDRITKGQKKFEKYHQELGEQVPLALHQASHGGRIAYLGFVNGESDIPKVVQALCLSLPSSEN